MERAKALPREGPGEAGAAGTLCGLLADPCGKPAPPAGGRGEEPARAVVGIDGMDRAEAQRGADGAEERGWAAVVGEPEEADEGAEAADMSEPDPELEALLGRHGVATTAETQAKEAAAKGPPAFAIAQNRFQSYKAAAKVKRAGIRQFIKPENALVVVRRLPEEGGTTHCILRGDFVLADLLPYLLEERYCPHLRIATLGMSEANASLLAELHRKGKVGGVTMVLSHYFEQVNKSTVYFDVRRILEGIADFVVMRSHAKVICCPRALDDAGMVRDWLVLEGSANLRSSDNLEQMTIFNDQAVHDFHAEWIDHVLANPPET